MTREEKERWDDADRRANDPSTHLRERVGARLEQHALERAVWKWHRDAARAARPSMKHQLASVTTPSDGSDALLNDSMSRTGAEVAEREPSVPSLVGEPEAVTSKAAVNDGCEVVTPEHSMPIADHAELRALLKPESATLLSSEPAVNDDAEPEPGPSAGAYDRDFGRFAKMHYDVFDSDQFKALGPKTKVLLLYVNLKSYGSNGYVSLALKKLKSHGFNCDSRRIAIEEAETAGFLRVTRRAKAGRTPAYYFPTWLRRPGEVEPPDTWAMREPMTCKDKLKPKRKPRKERTEQFFEKAKAA